MTDSYYNDNKQKIEHELFCLIKSATANNLLCNLSYLATATYKFAPTTINFTEWQGVVANILEEMEDRLIISHSASASLYIDDITMVLSHPLGTYGYYVPDLEELARLKHAKNEDMRETNGS